MLMLLLLASFFNPAYTCGSIGPYPSGPTPLVNTNSFNWRGSCGAVPGPYPYPYPNKPGPTFPGYSRPPSPYASAAGHDWSTLMGGNTAESALASRGAGQPISSISQLTCNGMVEPTCLWHNDPRNTAVRWRRGAGRPSQSRLRALTGTSVPPVDPYAFAYPESDAGQNGFAQLVSDPIRCQSGEGELSFAYWITRNVELKACTRPLSSGGQVSVLGKCSRPVVVNGAPGPAYLTLSPPPNQPFEIVIQARNFETPQDFAIVDDIEYNARLC